jgi:transposase
MLNQDARSLSPEAKEALRKRAVAAYRTGSLSQAQVAGLFGVHRSALAKWLKSFRMAGERGLDARPKGPAKGHGCLLTEKRAEEIRRLVMGKCPDQLRLPFALWTREAVRELIQRKYGVTVSINTAGNYLRAWGFTPQKPLRRAYEQHPAAVQRWLDEEYPALVKRAKSEGALIYWGDEMGLRSDHQVGRSYGVRGKTPVIPGTGKRFSCSMISAVTNRGHLCFQVFEGSFTVKVFFGFLKRLRRQAKRKVFLIVDGHPVHRAKLVQEWREKHRDELEIVYLPTYSPELNPDELLNQDVKGNAMGRRRPKDVDEMMEDVRGYLFSTQRRPEVIQSYFREEHVRYAMAG